METLGAWDASYFIFLYTNLDAMVTKFSFLRRWSWEMHGAIPEIFLCVSRLSRIWICCTFSVNLVGMAFFLTSFYVFPFFFCCFEAWSHGVTLEMFLIGNRGIVQRTGFHPSSSPHELRPWRPFHFSLEVLLCALRTPLFSAAYPFQPTAFRGVTWPSIRGPIWWSYRHLKTCNVYSSW